ncbi:hypothetical protein ACFOLJ_02450 [Rugamonas sp. CCM 8940]|uniref:hypothetical protein n=1 Tax=Rugamonas sp. CCM 8940 TaxID=2765359 RepID=UPI0018F66FB8|nr:hypothetical protein [Rugamonas sp. CCM 8940]MBJ7311803.1 hypothetical protein [Rugamonas sp. CCM 8940]
MPFFRNIPRIWIGLLLTLTLHLALLYALTLENPAAPPENGHAARPAIQWLLPPPPKRSTPRPPPPTAPAVPTRHQPAAKPAEATLLPPPPQAISAAKEAPAAEPAAAPQADAIFGAAPPSAADIMRQARHDLGKIDKDLRKEFPQRGETVRPDSKQARLERGINAAHEAVPPKWYEGATIKEISTLNSRVRIYKISTALGAYCITIKEDGDKRYTNCPS